MFVSVIVGRQLTGLVITANSSIVPPLDMYLVDVCNSAPCTNATLTSVANSIITGCTSDLANAKLSNATVLGIFGLYPLAREVACSKTSMPFNGTNATIPISPTTYNETGGTFCVTSLLTELSAYIGVNLTNSYVDTLILGGNSTALRMIEMIPRTALCSDCVFGAVDLIYQEYPQVGSLQLSSNMTVNAYLNGLCNSTGYSLTISESPQTSKPFRRLT